LERGLADSHAHPDPTVLARLRSLIGTASAQPLGLEQMIQTEEHTALLACDERGASPTQLITMIWNDPEDEPSPARILNVYALIYEQDRDAIQDGFNLMRQQCAATPQQRAAGTLKTMTQFQLEAKKRLAYLAMMLLPVFDRIQASFIAAQARWKVATLALAALDWHRTHNGTWPPNLEAMGFTAEELIDPCDPTGAKYLFLATPTTFTVWSVGRNGVDMRAASTPQTWRQQNEVFEVHVPATSGGN
jgi:hypothetical protein